MVICLQCYYVKSVGVEHSRQLLSESSPSMATVMAVSSSVAVHQILHFAVFSCLSLFPIPIPVLVIITISNCRHCYSGCALSWRLFVVQTSASALKGYDTQLKQTGALTTRRQSMMTTANVCGIYKCKQQTTKKPVARKTTDTLSGYQINSFG